MDHMGEEAPGIILTKIIPVAEVHAAFREVPIDLTVDPVTLVRDPDLMDVAVLHLIGVIVEHPHHIVVGKIILHLIAVIGVS